MEKALTMLCLILVVHCGEGDDLRKDGTSCKELECPAHSSCKEQDSNARCICESDYHMDGSSCVLDASTEPCYEIECTGPGSCIDDNGIARCECETGYRADGYSCVPDPCYGVSCSGRGSCIVEANSAACSCNNGYKASGLSCVVDPCYQVDCSGHGSCVDEGSQAHCQCDPQYEPSGLSCVFNPCHHNCSGRGICSVLGQIDYNCDCYARWWGDQCEHQTIAITPIDGNSFTLDEIEQDTVVYDPFTGLSWQQTYETDLNWNAAQQYCADLIYAGFNDWQTPTYYELLSIVDYSKLNAAIDETAFPATAAAEFWSKDSFENSSSDTRVWTVYFYNGRAYDLASNSLHHIRCIRKPALAAPATDRFLSQTDTVFDQATGLHWTASHANSRTWQGAKDYCDSLELASFDDWRLPSVKTLMSLIDTSEYNPASSFPGMPAQAFWSATAYASGSTKAWHIDFSNGWIDIPNKDETYAVYCVR